MCSWWVPGSVFWAISACADCGNSVVRRPHRRGCGHGHCLGAHRSIRFRQFRSRRCNCPVRPGARVRASAPLQPLSGQPASPRAEPSQAELLEDLPAGVTGWSRFAPTETNNWVRHQETFAVHSMLGLFAGGLSAGIGADDCCGTFPSAAGVAATVGFGISAMSLLFLSLGMSVPVTHHMTLIGGLAAVSFLPVVSGNMVLALLIGAVFGMVAAWLGEFFARFWHSHGDTHIDPPASAIWIMTTVVLGSVAVLS